MGYVFEAEPTEQEAHNHVITGRDQNGVIVEVRLSQNLETEAEADATFADLMNFLQGWTRIDGNGWSGNKVKGHRYNLVEEV